jgi:hypothetical protein
MSVIEQGRNRDANGSYESLPDYFDVVIVYPMCGWLAPIV